MPRAIVAPRPGPRPDGFRRRTSGDAGVSVIEMMVAIAVIGTVMTAMAPFLVKTMVSVGEQRTQQVAVELANDALERARALKPSSVAAGRGETATKAQLNLAPAKVTDVLATTTLAWDTDPKSAGTGPDAPLPTVPRDVTVHGVAYQQHWYIGRCWQKVAGSTANVVAMGGCTSPRQAATDPEFLRIVVAVTWRAAAATSQGSCTEGTCVYLASTLVSAGADPVFDLKRPPPTITAPGTRYSWTDEAVTYQLHASGGTLPRTWAATGLPAGLTLAADTGIVSGTPTAPGSSTVTVTVTDGENRADDATFTWHVAAPPVATTPADQTTRTGTTVSLAVAHTGGNQPLVWTSTGLPAGLTLNASTGVVSGKPTTEQTTMKPVTITATDAGQRKVEVTFGWRVLTPVTIYDPGTVQNMTNGTTVAAFTPYATGGLKPYTWKADHLPDGLTMDPATGTVSGKVVSGTRYLTTATVTDAAGGTATVTVVCNVKESGNGDLRITTPAPSAPDRTTTVGGSAALTPAAAGGGLGAYSWAATGLPPGTTFDKLTGKVGGTTTQAGTYVVKLTVTAVNKSQAHMMFTWRVS